MSTDELGLAEAIEAVRRELRDAQERGAGDDVRFTVGPVDLEFAVDVTKTGGGGASVKVLGVVDIGGKGEFSTANTHRVKISLNPVTKDGEPFEVAANSSQRPD
jgi:hypothetical protein